MLLHKLEQRSSSNQPAFPLAENISNLLIKLSLQREIISPNWSSTKQSGFYLALLGVPSAFNLTINFFFITFKEL